MKNRLWTALDREVQQSLPSTSYATHLQPGLTHFGNLESGSADDYPLLVFVLKQILEDGEYKPVRDITRSVTGRDMD